MSVSSLQYATTHNVVMHRRQGSTYVNYNIVGVRINGEARRVEERSSRGPGG